jgi:hypothetical protein
MMTISDCGDFPLEAAVDALFAPFGADEARKGIERQSKNPKTALGIFVLGRWLDFG